MKSYVPRTATFAWAPPNADPSGPDMATGTVAGALDESFNNDSILELWKLPESDEDAREPFAMGSVRASARFHQLGWTYAHAEKPHGLLVGGLENGEVGVWDVDKLLSPTTAASSQVMRNAMHKGPVRGLSTNRLQPHLTATGSVDAEIFVWDLRALGKPYAPGERSMHLDEITSMSWHSQVAHVLATAAMNGTTTVWDLRQKKQVALLRMAQARASAGDASVSALAWHPLTPTRIAVAYESDANPVVALWDLRNSREPEALFRGHERGVLGLSWCPWDEGMVLSCGKDHRTLCWNPQTHEVVAEMPARNNWAFGVQWDTRFPDMMAVASFDGQVAVENLHSLGAEAPAPLEVPASMNAEDVFSSLGSMPVAASGGMALKTPPKWMRRPVSAVFGFGGQLVSLAPPKAGQSFAVHMREVCTEPHIAERARALADALAQGTLSEFCAEQCERETTRPADVANWKALQTLFQAESRDELVALLGFSKELVAQQVQDAVAALGPSLLEDEAEEAPAPPAPADEGDAASFFDREPAILPAPVEPPAPFSLHPGGAQDPDRLVTQALVLGDLESAVSLLVAQDRFADALVLATRVGDELLLKTQRAFFKRHASRVPYLRLLKSIVLEDLQDVVLHADLADWQELFVVLCTFAKSEDFYELSAVLGERLEDMPSATAEDRKNAALCYLAAGRLEKVLAMWMDEMKDEESALQRGDAAPTQLGAPVSAHAEALQTLIEKVVVFQYAVQYTDADLQPPEPNEDGTVPEREFALAPLYDLFLEYANLLTEQGLVDLALQYVAMTPSDYVSPSQQRYSDAEWAHDRLLRAGQSASYAAEPSYGYGASYDAAGYGGYAQPAQPVAPPPPMAPVMAQPVAPPPAAAPLPPPPMAHQTPARPSVPSMPAPSAPSPYVPAADAYAASAPAPEAPPVVPNSHFQAPYAAPTAMQAPPPPVIGAPLATSFVPDVTQAPPPPPAATPIQRDQGGWNDVPAGMAPPPKRAQAPAATASAITSPFPGATTPSAPPPGSRQSSAALPPPPRGPSQARAAAAAPPPPPPTLRTNLGLGHPSAQGVYDAAWAGEAAPTAAPPSSAPLRPQTTGPPPGHATVPPPRTTTPATGGGYGAPRGAAQGAARSEFQHRTYPRLTSARGDRSHIAPSWRPVVDMLQSEIQRLRSIDAQPRRILDDADRRVQLLLDLLNNQRVDMKMQPSLLQLAQAIRERNQPQALAIHVQLATMASGDTATALVGVKFIIAKLTA